MADAEHLIARMSPGSLRSLLAITGEKYESTPAIKTPDPNPHKTQIFSAAFGTVLFHFAVISAVMAHQATVGGMVGHCNRAVGAGSGGAASGTDRTGMIAAAV